MGKYNIHRILEDGIKKFSEKDFIFERNGNSFLPKSYERFAKDVRGIARALIGMGLKGKNLLMYGCNSYNYMAADAAIMAYVGKSCTISKEWAQHDLLNAARQLNAAALIYSSDKRECAESLKQQLPQLILIQLDSICNIAVDGDTPIPAADDECCKIIYSSGTTGMPKAVMLSQDNMFANYDSLIKRTPFTPQDKDYLFLPLSHTYAGICNFLYAMISGMSLYLCSDTKLIMEELQMVKPTVFCSVPLIYEKLYAACTSQQLPPAAALGGNTRFLFSGGAYMRPEIRRFLKDAGLDLHEAYGLTETSSLISCEYSDPDDTESVGAVLEGMELAIDSPDENGVGEITVRGGNVFTGYFNNDEATKRAFTEDGFFRTGDLGSIRNGKLYIVGRKRRMILTANGENVFPDEIEDRFAKYPQISKAKVYERDNYIAAAIYTTEECDTDTIIAEVNETLPKYAQIRIWDTFNDSIDARIK